MTAFYTRDLICEPSRCDFSARLSVADAFSLFLDAAGEHAEALGVGIAPMLKRGLFWLTVRTRVRFYRRPKMLDTVTLSTWPEAPGKARCCRDYAITSGGETLIEGKTEWAVLETGTGALHSLSDIYPPDMEFHTPNVLEGRFMRVDPDFSAAREQGRYTVRSTDLDLGGHMNNAAYVRALCGAFSRREWEEMDIRELEVAFRHQTYEGETLRFMRRDGDGFIDISADVDGREVFLARFTLGGGQPVGE